MGKRLIGMHATWHVGGISKTSVDGECQYPTLSIKQWKRFAYLSYRLNGGGGRM